MGHNVVVTILLPVYNGALYLTTAIDSILSQTFENFELLIINDASTDETATILKGYTDTRIRLITNANNLGLIGTLNLGLQEARGHYLARMDQDDIAEQDRLAQQVHYLDEHKDCAVVASTITLINSKAMNIGEWFDDVQNISNQDIRQYLPKANCIAHPSIMGRTSILKQYRYSKDQIAAEDYDLWLRLTADDVSIEKINLPLLRYRVHPSSITQQSLKQTGSWKNIQVKGRFIKNQLLHAQFNRFTQTVCFEYCKDIVWFTGFSCARGLYHTIRNSFIILGVQLGRVVGLWKRRNVHSRHFFFLHSYGIGGAESVHASITATIADQSPWIVFTNSKQTEPNLLSVFKKSGKVLDLSRKITWSIGYGFQLGKFSTIINHQDQPVVFGALSGFFYKLLPLLKKPVTTIDLTHAFDGTTEQLTLQYVPYLKHRVAINQAAYDDLTEQYTAHKIDRMYDKRLQIIENGIPLPTFYQTRSHLPFHIIYLGRGTYEKRLHLITQIARRCKEIQLPVQFTLVGEIPESIQVQYADCCTFRKTITAAVEKAGLLESAHCLMMTSSREGFPISIMEAMAYGAVPITTNVGGISQHVHHEKNGLLIDNKNEHYIVDAMTEYIQYYSTHLTEWEVLSHSAYNYAQEHFGIEQFNQHYQQLLLNK